MDATKETINLQPSWTAHSRLLTILLDQSIGSQQFTWTGSNKVDVVSLSLKDEILRMGKLLDQLIEERS